MKNPVARLKVKNVLLTNCFAEVTMTVLTHSVVSIINTFFGRPNANSE